MSPKDQMVRLPDDIHKRSKRLRELSKGARMGRYDWRRRMAFMWEIFELGCDSLELALKRKKAEVAASTINQPATTK
jgi:hypothetical protein